MSEKKEYIRIRGAREHNLKNINIDIPRNEFVVLTEDIWSHCLRMQGSS